MTDYEVEPTKTQQFIAEINGTGKSVYGGALKALSIRLPVETYAKVAAIEKFIGDTSKNKIINDLLEIAFEQIYPSLNDVQKASFNTVPITLLGGLEVDKL